ncbi:helix-loop-helix DNA-binding domain-containing protein [Annulohypoxylon bovei var. microspora]|nr:helix-loop-helix DNA-binding domain-containing protein [Annulohypoxylon bovei var. microspora]
MAMMDPSGWNGQDQTMSSTGEDDFQQFLEMGGMSNLGDGLQFDFQDFGNNSGTSMMHQQHGDTIDTPMSNSNIPTIIARNDIGQQSQMSPMTSAPNHSGISSQMMPQHHTSSDPISEIDAQIQFLQQQRLQQQRRQLAEQQRQFHEQQAAFFAQQRNMVPPTPQSLEIQAANQFFAQQDQAHSSGMFDGYHLKEQQDMAFTPLVSPAVTPLEPHFPVDPGFTHSGPYFSPLTSPALHAQNESSTFDHRNSGQTTNSPVEMDIEPSPAINNNTANLSKKVRKSNATKARKPNVRQSPITKPQRRKTASTPIMNAQVLSELTESIAESSEHPPKPKSVSTTSAEESENASVSPEALSDMPPPPLPPPRSARQSPYIQPQANQTNGNAVPSALPTSLAGKPSPATPASLFRISPKSKSADANDPEQSGSEHIESFELPESVNFSKPDLPSLDTRQPTKSPAEIETAKASTFQPLPSPVFPKPAHSATASATQSPLLTPKSGTTNARKTPLIAPRGPKKRTSISSVSPALRPKISPNIKPLLPGTPGLSAEDSASRLLASKSNYQNILEGNTVPGVSYPSELSTNLTSKRTSHKIAEQGRRNRINSALQEIATLLPKSVTKDLSEGDGEGGNADKKDGKQANTPNSKASTVELAIIYIKQLQEEIAEANRRADEAEKRLEEKATVS